jgi:hypothetical protein
MKSSHTFLHREPDAYCNQLKNKPSSMANRIPDVKISTCFYFRLSKNANHFFTELPTGLIQTP